MPVPEAEELVARWRPLWDPPAPAGVMAHITVLFPFLRPTTVDERVLQLVADAVGGVEPFAFTLVEVGRFPQTVYLAPQPAGPFAELTREVWQRFPARPPYAGRHPGVVPHVTVATTPDAAVLERAAAAAASAVPIVSRASAVWLLEEDDHGSYHVAAEVKLGR